MNAPIALLGIDLGKHSFHIHAQDASGAELLRRRFSRSQLLRYLARLTPCVVAMESCAGAHWLARRLAQFGHQPKLVPPQYVRAFVKGNKHDFADAQAICEAACRPSMHFAAPKSAEQQALGATHRVRESLVAQRTATANQIHAFLLEFGISLGRGAPSVRRVLSVAHDESLELPTRLRELLGSLHEHWCELDRRIKAMERELAREVAADETASRLTEIPGIGPITASLLCAQANTARQYRSSRDFAAYLGLVPRQHSTGGRPRLLGISKRGDGNLRRLLVLCARALMQRLAHYDNAIAQWTRQMLTRRHSNVVACALAAKLARIVWAVLTRGARYHPYPSVA